METVKTASELWSKHYKLHKVFYIFNYKRDKCKDYNYKDSLNLFIEAMDKLSDVPVMDGILTAVDILENDNRILTEFKNKAIGKNK